MFERNTNETMIALEESITHWEDELKRFCATGQKPLMVTTACALCERFDEMEGGNRTCVFNGEKCPVHARSGDVGCNNTPFKRYPTEDTMNVEIVFLKSLREYTDHV